jgi:hypothetical protein
MPQHLVTCSCGRKTPVELSQAGEVLRCECGATLSVPTFRQLRELPVAAAERAQVSASRTWGARQGAIAANLIIASLLLLGAGVNRYFEPLLPLFNPAVRNQVVSGGLDKIGPAESWKAWTENYRQLGRNGFVPFQHPLTQLIQESIDQHRRMQIVLVGAAAFCGLVAGVLWVSGGKTNATAMQ